MRRNTWVLGCTLAVALVASPASAQEVTVFGTGAADGDGTDIALLGLSVRPEGLGLKPVVGVQGYWLRYDAGLDSNADVFAITPSVGLQYRGTGAAVEGRVGYNFQDRNVSAPIIEGEGGGSGVTTTLLASSWATRPELQGVASYSWNSDFLWTQAQATVPVVQLNPGNLGVGAEAIYQADTSNGLGGGQHALQLGPVLRYNDGRSTIVQLGAGWKDNSAGSDTYYVRLSLVRYGLHL